MKQRGGCIELKPFSTVKKPPDKMSGGCNPHDAFRFVHALDTGLLMHTFGCTFNQHCDGIWLRHIDRVAARNLDDCGTRALGHEALGRKWNHFVLSGDQIPTRFVPPCRLTDRAAECFDAPRDLGVSHEGGLFCGDVGSE